MCVCHIIFHFLFFNFHLQIVYFSSAVLWFYLIQTKQDWMDITFAHQEKDSCGNKASWPWQWVNNSSVWILFRIFIIRFVIGKIWCKFSLQNKRYQCLKRKKTLVNSIWFPSKKQPYNGKLQKWLDKISTYNFFFYGLNKDSHF